MLEADLPYSQLKHAPEAPQSQIQHQHQIGSRLTKSNMIIEIRNQYQPIQLTNLEQLLELLQQVHPSCLPQQLHHLHPQSTVLQQQWLVHHTLQV
jgi:hypothetical protein